MRYTSLTAEFILAALLAAPALAGSPQPNPNYNPPPAKEGFSYPDCYCTDSKGQRIELGQRACLTIGTREVLARCDMSVNNPTWRMENEGCPGV